MQKIELKLDQALCEQLLKETGESSLNQAIIVCIERYAQLEKQVHETRKHYLGSQYELEQIKQAIAKYYESSMQLKHLADM